MIDYTFIQKYYAYHNIIIQVLMPQIYKFIYVGCLRSYVNLFVCVFMVGPKKIILC